MKKAAIVLFAAIMILTLFACVKPAGRDGVTTMSPADVTAVTEEPAGTPEPVITLAPVTAEPIGTPEPEPTEAPATEAPVEPTEAPATEKPSGKKGCGNMIGGSAFAIVAVLSAVCVFAKKKNQ